MTDGLLQETWQSTARTVPAHVRHLSWRKLAAAAADQDFVRAHALDLCRLVFHALDIYPDCATRRAIYSTLSHAVKSKAFSIEFSNELSTLAVQTPAPGRAGALVQWSCLVLRHLDSSIPHETQSASKLIGCQCVWLKALDCINERRRPIQHAIASTLNARPDLLDVYIGAASTQGCAALVRVLWAYLASQSKRPKPGVELQLIASYAAKLQQIFVEKVLSAKERPSERVLSCYGPLLAAADPQQITEVILPAVVRMIRRSPEAALPTTDFVLKTLPKGICDALLRDEVLPALLQQARHAKETVRHLAIHAASSLGRSLQDPSVLQASVEQAQQVLDGSQGGKLKSPQERASVAAVIGALAEKGSPGFREKEETVVQTIGQSTVEFICALYKDEIADDVKLALILALKGWLLLCTVEIPVAALDRLRAGLQEKEALRRAHLRALSGILSSKNGAALKNQTASLIPILCKIALEGNAKAASRMDGILALLAAACIAAEDASADSALDAAGVWAVTRDVECPLFSPSTASTLAVEDAEVMAQLCGVLLTWHTSHLNLRELDAATAAVTAAKTLTLLALHYSLRVRKASQDAIKNILHAKPEQVLLLLRALRFWVSSPGTVTVIQDPMEGDVPIAMEAVHERFLHALCFCVLETSPKITYAAAYVGEILLLAHHPLIAAARRGGSGNATWRVLSRRRKGGEFLDTVIRAHPRELSAILFGKRGVGSGDPGVQAAAYGAIRTAAQVAAPELFAPMMGGLQQLLDTSAHDAITARQLRIYATPLGRTSNENEDGSIIPMELFEDMLSDKSNVKPPVFPPAIVAVDSPHLTQENEGTTAAGTNGAPRRSAVQASSKGASKSHGGKGPGKSDPAADARQRQLKAESEVRAGVILIREKLTNGLFALGAFSSGNASFSAEHLGELAAPALPLLTSPLVGDAAAFDCVRQLAACIPGSPGWRALDVAAALRLVAIAENSASPPDYQRVAAHRCIASSVSALQIATGGRPAPHGDDDESDILEPAVPGTRALPAPVYAFCFPILRAILSCARPTPLHDQALMVVALHVGSESPVPKPQTFALLYHALEILPAFRDRIQGLLRTLCTGLTEEDAGTTMAAAMQGLTSGQAVVRAATLQALDATPYLTAALNYPSSKALLWMASTDVDESNAAAGKALWERTGASISESTDLIGPMSKHLESQHADIRTAAATALARGVAEFPVSSHATSDALAVAVGLYHAESSRSTRLGSAAAIRSLAPCLASSTADLTVALDFLLGNGLLDDDARIKAEMMAAGVAVVDAAGKTHAGEMLPLLESRLESKAADASTRRLTEEQYDHVRQGAVVFLGTLARHLDPENPKVKSIVGILIEVLTTPSETVQRSVSDCLPPLMSALSGDKAFVEGTVKQLLDRTLRGKTYGDRRGAAFGVAGAVKGLGLSSLKGFGVMDALKAGLDDKTDPGAREGALSAFECLSEKLGRLFEPYVIQILSMLLTAFGDSVPAVREAAHAAARAIMGQLSAQGVKLVLPAMLRGVEDRTWRTKQGSIQLLGAMAYCAPKQLSACLPTIVPRLSEVLADPHPKVCAAAREALDEVGSVIRNPEISRLVPTLLAAVADPDKNNKKALDTLLTTVFVNTIDAASLALIVPVVHRGLRDRSGDVKKRAARIVGNLSKLINDPKDMSPYVPLLMPQIQAALVDPLPEVRATAAKALGALTLGMGAAALGGINPWLVERMHSESSAVERSGAAQGLAEVLAVQGAPALEEVLPGVIEGCSAKSAAAREGCLTLFKYLPYAMPDVFKPHLPDMLPCVLNGLADEAEGVRDAALSAGRVAVELYSTSALPLLLPCVEAGTVNGNWRIRQSSVELMGDLLFKVVGTSGRIQQDVHDDEAEGISIESHGLAIIEALGVEKRNDVLARVYIARSDVAYTVRAAALHVWKTLVTNTPKTLGEILPALMAHVIAGLGAEGEDRRESVSRCLGELVRKMGERVLSQIVPILRDGISGGDAATRAGVCEGLREVMGNATRQQLAEHIAELLPAVQGALCDENAQVRAAAGGVFDVLFKSGGGGNAVDSVIPSLLSSLDSDDTVQASQALEGLRVVLGVRPQLLSAMAPRLVRPPVTAANLKALGALAEVAGAALHGLLPAIVAPLLVHAASDSPNTAAARTALGSVASAVQDDGVHTFIAEVHKGLDDPVRRKGAAVAVVAFCGATKLDFQEEVRGLLGSLIPLLAEDDVAMATAIWEAVAAVMASIPKEMAPSFVRTVKEAIAAARERERRKRQTVTAARTTTSASLGIVFVPIPGLSLPKALTPFLPVYLQGVLQGSSAELRELAAEGLGELIEVSGEEALKPCVVQIAGPLIRIMGDRFPWQTKAAILKTMGLLVSRAGASLRPFIPQLQSTFVKCLPDPAREVRRRAAANLGDLSGMALRLDQMVNDLAINARTAELAVQEAYLMALEGVIVAAGDRLSVDALSAAGAAAGAALVACGDVRGGTGDDEELVLRAAAGALGAYAARCSEGELQKVLQSYGPLSPAPAGLGPALVAAAIAKYASKRLDDIEIREGFVQSVVRLIKSSNTDLKRAVGVTVGRLVVSEISATGSSSQSLPAFVPVLVALLGPDQSSELHKQALAVLRAISAAPSQGAHVALGPYYPELVPSVLSVIQDSSGTMKLSTERTLARILALELGPEAATSYLSGGKAGPLARQVLTETYLRRLARLPILEEDDLADYAI